MSTVPSPKPDETKPEFRDDEKTSSAAPRVLAVETDTDGSSRQLVYDNPLTTVLRTLKMVSVTSCVTSLCAAPLLAIYGNPSVSVMGRMAWALIGTPRGFGCCLLLAGFICVVVLFGAVALAGSGTTAVLHATLKSTVVSAHLIFPPPPLNVSDPARPPRIAITTLSLTGRRIVNVD